MNLGTYQGGKAATIDLPRLLETRMLVQANSGGGKSWLLRRMLEQTAPHVQQLVIDPEGEFATLREKFDYVIAAPHDGDAVANAKTAAVLAKRLLETGVSAILDIYDLKAAERQAFVRLFLSALVNAPRKLWHPVLLVIDEAHVFCPQVGGADAAGAVIDVCTRGRKRGLCPILATQRLSKLHKDAAAEMLNKLVGRTGLDVDVKRAADELGMSGRDAVAQLRGLAPGEFYAFGPALSVDVQKLTVGAVATTHPQSGHRLMAAPPAPSARVMQSLAKLADLQQAADQEVADNESLRRQVSQLQRELRASKGMSTVGVPEADVALRIQNAIDAERARQRVDGHKPVPDHRDAALRGILQTATAALQGLQEPASRASRRQYERLAKAPAPRAIPKAEVSGLRAGAVRILQELAARSPAGYTRAQVGTLTGFAPKGGTFGTYLGDLRRGGFIEERAGLVFATTAGIEHLGADVPAAPTSHEDAMAIWRKALRAGAFRMLEAIVDAGQDGMDRASLASVVGMEKAGGTFGTYLGDLRRNGLITETRGVAVANDILFPGGTR